jgi:hypothetical protein
MEQMKLNFFILPGGAGLTREAERRLWDGNAAKHSESFCRLFPCLSRQYLGLRCRNVVMKGLNVVKDGQKRLQNGGYVVKWS